MKTLFVSIILLTGAISFSASSQVISTDIYGVQSAFNAAYGKTRVIFFGDPTCPGCIASANDLRNYVFNYCNSPDLRGFIVWMHVSGFPSTYSSGVTQSASWSDPRVTFYWDSIGTDMAYNFGYLNAWSGCNYAWDMSVVYTDTATWSATVPNVPHYCMSKTGCCNGYNIFIERTQLIALGECYATAIDEHIPLLPGLNVFPNPVSDFIMLNDETTYAPSQVQVISILGNSILEVHNQNKIDVSGLRPGIYFIRVKQQDKIYSARFVKK